MPGFKPDTETVSAEQNHQRQDLQAALVRLEQRPWTPASGQHGDGFVNLIFGGGSPSPRSEAEGYLLAIEGDQVLQVRRDLETTLSAAWNVAHTGRQATTSMQPMKSDLRTIEDAIVEARHCRLVYAEALILLARDDTAISRDEVRRVKERFNQAIMELGRTADALSLRLQNDPDSSSYALRDISS